MNVSTWTWLEGFLCLVGADTCNSLGLTGKPQWTVLMLCFLRALPGIRCQTSFAWCKQKAEGSDWLMWPTSDHTVIPLGSLQVLGLSIHSSLEVKQKPWPVQESVAYVHSADRPHAGFLNHRQPHWLSFLSDAHSVSYPCWPTGTNRMNTGALPCSLALFLDLCSASPVFLLHGSSALRINFDM